jgi:hypothetical protein
MFATPLVGYSKGNEDSEQAKRQVWHEIEIQSFKLKAEDGYRFLLRGFPLCVVIRNIY